MQVSMAARELAVLSVGSASMAMAACSAPAAVAVQLAKGKKERASTTNRAGAAPDRVRRLRCPYMFVTSFQLYGYIRKREARRSRGHSFCLVARDGDGNAS